MDNPKFKFTFGWDLCYICNYRCPYCEIWKKGYSPENLSLTAEEWGIIWDRIYDKYGNCHIYMSGGEPSVYPYFYDLVKRLTKKHSVGICTNLSWNIEQLVPDIPAGILEIAPTFHPACVQFEEFFDKVVKIKDYLDRSRVFYVVYPGQIEEIPERSKRLKEVGIDFIPMPLRGEDGVSNSEEEKQIVEELNPYRDAIEYQLQRISPKGKLCRAGQYYVAIRANGMVDRCSQYGDGQVGNFLDENFSLFKDPLPCEKEYCPIESQWIINK